MLIRALLNQKQAATDGFKQLCNTPYTTFITCIIIGITLAFPAILKLAIDNAALLNKQLKQSATLTIYLKKDATLSNAQQLTKILTKRPDVLATETISPEAGLHQLELQTNLADINSVTADLPNNPLPWVIIVTPISTQDPLANLTLLKRSIENIAEMNIIDTIQLDTQWITELTAILNTTHSITLALAALLAVSVLFIIGNTIWAIVRQHHKEISIIRLTGGTHGFIRRPFLYAGAIYGCLGAFIACFFINSLTYYIEAPIHQLAILYRSNFSLITFSFKDTCLLLSIGMLLGLFGAWLAVTRYLYLPENIEIQIK